MAITNSLQIKRPTAQLTAPQPVQQATTKPAAPLATTRPTATAVQGALTGAKAPSNTMRPGGALPAAAATTAPTPRPAPQPSAQQQALLAADRRPMTAADNDAARAYDLANGVGQPAARTLSTVGGTALNPATGQPYTPQEVAEEQAAYDAARAADLAWQQQHYPAMFAANQKLVNPDGSRQGTWIPDPNNPSDDPSTWHWQPYVANATWAEDGFGGQFQQPNNPTGPGITGGVQQTQFTGMDLTDPGAAEQFFGENAWRFGLPTALTEQGAWWEQNMGQLGQPGVAEDTFTSSAPQLRNQGLGENYVENLAGTYRPGSYPTGSNLSSEYAQNFEKGGDVSNRADEFFQQFMASMPEINPNAGLDPYYDRARAKAAEDINRQMAARGLWGSSAAGGMISDAMTELGAEQANREAQYYLDTLGEMRGWQGLGGDLASSSDTSSRGKAENERAWAGLEADVNRSADDVTARLADQERTWATDMGQLGLSADAAQRARLQQLQSGASDSQRAMLERLGFGADMAGNLDQAELERLTAGMNAASQAQSGQRQRGQDYFNNTMGMGGAMADTMAGQYNPMITEDKALLDDILAMLTGSGAERLAGAQRATAGAQQTQNAQQEALLTAVLMAFAGGG